MDRYCTCKHTAIEHVLDMELNPIACLIKTCECTAFVEAQLHITTDKKGEMKIVNDLSSCPFCVWDANDKAEIRMALALSACPCTQRNTVGEAKYLEAVVYHFRDKLEKLLLEKFDWAALQKLRKQSP